MKKSRILICSISLLMFFISLETFASNVAKEVPMSNELANESRAYLNKPWNVNFHDEIVASLFFTRFSKNELLLTARVEKRHFILALKKEGACAPKDMMRLCGNQYLLNNLEISINDRSVQLSEESLDIEKDYVNLTYTISLSEPVIKDIKVKTDYMFSYNDHSIIKVVFDMDGPTRSFNIKNKRRSITARFDRLGMND